MKFKFILLFVLALFTIQNAEAQKSNKKFKISGYVKDTNGNPLAGAMILLDNNNTGKITNNNGHYKIKVNPDNRIISVFTMTGASTGIPIEGRSSISFILEESDVPQYDKYKSKDPYEVINTGYGYVKKDNFAQPADKINITETDYSSYNNIYDLLRTKLPGVEVVGEKVYVRGSSTIIGGSDPLFVVDGVIMESIGLIQPNIVKSVNLLKGSAAAIYGVRGSNGVIIINTIK
jgi:TonB-dependent SusC/RagA subfamily outer membrane receptor